MQHQDIEKIETTLGYSLPPDYKAFLIQHTDELIHAGNLLKYYATLWTDAEEIIQGNLDARTYAADMVIGEDESHQQSWPEYYLVVGTNGGGDFWFIDRTGTKSGLWFWQHEENSITQVSISFEQYLANVRRDMEHPNQWPGQKL